MKYSFIVPVYGCEDHLENCVGSLLAQRLEGTIYRAATVGFKQNSHHRSIVALG